MYCYLANFCFMCLKDVNKLHLNSTEDCTLQQIKYILPEITLEPQFPIYICSTCRTELNSFCAFKKLCMENYCRLKYFKKLLQGLDNTKDQLFSTLQIEINDIKKVKHVDVGITSTWDLSDQDKIDIKEELIEIEESKVQNLYNIKERDSEQDLISEDTNKMHRNESITSKDEIQNYAYCKICDKMFKEKYYLKHHMKIHNSIKDFQCPICKNSFRYKPNLTVHMKIHYGIKDFKCSICDKKFTHKGNLNGHMKTHAGIKDVQCSICYKMFSSKKHLNMHMKIHAGIKEFQCFVCDRKFIQKGALTTHIKIHYGIKEFKCSICDKSFRHKCTLNTHMKMHAGNKDL